MTAIARRAATFWAPPTQWLLIGLAACAAAGLLALRLGSGPLPATTPINPEIEARWGIRITQVGVTADGGLIDVRYIVLDADKALGLLTEESNFPVLVDEGSGHLIRSAALMTAKHNVAAGNTSFMLYRNTRGWLAAGGRVTIRFDDLRLEHVPVL